MSFTEGELRWIKRHTEKSLKELNNMKPTKPVKKRPAKENHYMGLRMN